MNPGAEGCAMVSLSLELEVEGGREVLVVPEVAPVDRPSKSAKRVEVTDRGSLGGLVWKTERGTLEQPTSPAQIKSHYRCRSGGGETS